MCPSLQATALSQAVITGGALGSVAYSISRRHPRDPGCPLVDWDLALTICPGLLLGVSTGVLLNIALPAWCGGQGSGPGYVLGTTPRPAATCCGRSAAAGARHCIAAAAMPVPCMPPLPCPPPRSG